MGKRFARLEAGLKYLRSSTATTIPIAPEGSALREYQDWKGRQRLITYTRESGSNPDRILKAVLSPFGLPLAVDTEALVPLSQRASLSSVGAAMKTAGNYETEGFDGVLKLSGFRSAKAIVFIGTGTSSSSTETSQITGVKYKQRNGASYTFPYGASTAEPKERGVRAKILTALSATANTSVSFKSERL